MCVYVRTNSRSVIMHIQNRLCAVASLYFSITEFKSSTFQKQFFIFNVTKFLR